MDDEETINCVECDQPFYPEELSIFTHKGKGIRIEGVCDDCFNALTSKHERKPMRRPAPARAPEPEVPTLNRRNLSALGGGTPLKAQDDQRSNGSFASHMSGDFSKFYCCEKNCKTPTGKLKHFRSSDRWMVHMLQKHKASLTYPEYLMMDHVIGNLPHDEDEVGIVSKFGNLGF